MTEGYNVERMLTLRKLTRAVADQLRAEMKEHLATLSPLLRPRSVFGEYIEHGTKESVHGSDKAFKELQELYEAIAASPSFNLPRELKPPFEVFSSALEFTPFDYTHEARAGAGAKTVVVTSPLKWVLSYAGFPPGRFRELLASRDRPEEEVRQFLLHYLVLDVVVRRQAGVARILEALHFPVGSAPSEELGGAPVTFVSSDVSTRLPDDAVIIESTEVSGNDAFEEVVNLDDVAALRNPLKERLLELLGRHGERVVAG
jgi:hypothetical protein